jgi:hypothetical protein
LFLYIGKKIRFLKVIIYFLIIGLSFYSLMGFVYQVIWAVFISFLVGLFIQLYSVSWENFTLSRIREEYIARTSSVSWFVFNAMSPFSISLFGYIVEEYGSRQILLSAPLILIIIIILISILYKKNKI